MPLNSGSTSPARPVASGAHVIARIAGARSGPCLIAFGGIHGNEPAGVLAARRVAAAIESRADRIRGDVLLLAGNTRALVHDLRYLDVDLNRHWARPRLDKLAAGISPDEIA